MNLIKKIKKEYSRRMWPKDKECIFCGHRFHSYRWHGADTEASLKYNTVCMGRRKGDCPFCGSSDKYRWLWWVIENKTEICNSAEKCEVLQFAPEKPVYNRLKQSKYNNHYITGDIVPGRADEVIDMTDIHYPDKSFDYIIASMVMEHIVEEEKALCELVRVLKDDGMVLLTVPIALGLESTLDDGETEDSARIRKYGQIDHVRLYALDIDKRWSRLLSDKVFIEGCCPVGEIGKNGAKKMGLSDYYYVWQIRKRID